MQCLNRNALLEKKIHLEKQLSVGLDIRKKDVFVYATSQEQFDEAERVLREEVNDGTKRYESPRESVTKTLCSTAWNKVLHLAKSSKVFAEPKEDGTAILIKRGSLQGVAAFCSALDELSEKIWVSSSSRSTEAVSGSYNHDRGSVMQALCTTLWDKVVIEAKRFSVFAQKGEDDYSIHVRCGSKLKKANFPTALTNFCQALDSLAITVEEEDCDSERDDFDVPTSVYERSVFILGGTVMLPLVESHVLEKIHLLFPTVTVQLNCDASVPKIILQFQGSKDEVESAGDWTEKQRGSFSWTNHTFESNEAECLQTGIASNALDLHRMGREFNATCDVSRLSEGILSVAAISPGDPRAFRESIDAYLECHLLVTSTYSLTDLQIEFLKRFRLQKPWLGFGDVIDQTGIEQLSPSFLGNCLFLKGLKQNVKFALKELEKRFRRFREMSFHLSYPEGSRRAFESELSTIGTKLTEDVFVATSFSKINKTVNVSLTGFCDLSSAKEAFVSLSKSLHRYRKPVRVSSDTRSIIYQEALKRNLPIGMDDDTLVVFSTSSEKSAEAVTALEEVIEEVRTERMRSTSANEHRDDYNLFSNSVKPSPSKPNFGAKILNVETDETPCYSLAFNSSASASASDVGAELTKATSASENNGIELDSECASYLSSSSRSKQESSLPESTDMNCFSSSLKTVLKEERTEFQSPNFPSPKSFSELTNPSAAEFSSSEVPAASRCQETQIGRKKSKEILPLQHEHKSNSLSESPRLLKEIPFLSLGKVIEIYSGSIAHECVDVIITATNEDLILQPDVAAIGGNSLEQECRQYVKDNGYVSSGRTVVTGGGNLRCKRVLHAVIASIDTETYLRERLRQCFDDVEAMSARSVALPLLFSDTCLSIEKGFAITVEEIQRRFEEKCFVKVVRLVDSNPMLMNVAGAEALSSKSAVPPMRIFEWRYLNDDDRFQPFPFVINAQLEKFFAQAKGDMQLQLSDDVYDMFYETHTNLASGLVRPIRRCLKGSPCPNPDAKWYFIDEMKAQQPYDVASSFRLDSAFRRNARLVSIDVGAFSYEIDFVSMTQKDVKSGKKKLLVRVDVVDSLSPPRRSTSKEASGTGISSFFKKMFSKSETKRFRISSDTGVALSSDFRRIAETFGVEMNFVTDAGCENAEVQLKGVKSRVQKAHEAIQEMIDTYRSKGFA